MPRHACLLLLGGTMKLFGWKKQMAVLFGAVGLLVAFQNCSPMGFSELGSNQLVDSNLSLGQPYSLGGVPEDIPFQDYQDNPPVNDGSSDVVTDPETAFEEVFVLDDNVEEEYVENSVRSSWECRFTLKGELGATWSVIRYNAAGDCAYEATIVRSNNPKATIISQSKVFVKDPMGPVTPSTSHWACNFTLKGALGNTWSVIRNVAAKDECVSQIPIVKTNNPNATIIQQTVTFVAVSTASKSKWMCYYTLKGEKGYVWNSERESTDSKSCAAQTAIVRANNPKATITKIVGPSFVKLQ